MANGLDRDYFLSKCNRCGYCCSESQSGDVFLYPADFFRIREFLAILDLQFINRYLKMIEYEYHVRNSNLKTTGESIYLPIFAIKMKKKAGCPFYDPHLKSCRIYPARPDQCRFFPLIYCILEDSEQLEDMRKNCLVIQEILKHYSNERLENFQIPEYPREIITKEERTIEYQYYIFIMERLPPNWDDLSEKAQKKALLKLYQEFTQF